MPSGKLPSVSKNHYRQLSKPLGTCSHPSINHTVQHGPYPRSWGQQGDIRSKLAWMNRNAWGTSTAVTGGQYNSPVIMASLTQILSVPWRRIWAWLFKSLPPGSETTTNLIDAKASSVSFHVCPYWWNMYSMSFLPFILPPTRSSISISCLLLFWDRSLNV